MLLGTQCLKIQPDCRQCFWSFFALLFPESRFERIFRIFHLQVVSISVTHSQLMIKKLIDRVQQWIFNCLAAYICLSLCMMLLLYTIYIECDLHILRMLFGIMNWLNTKRIHTFRNYKQYLHCNNSHFELTWGK
jgi:hypothetical protein